MNKDQLQLYCSQLVLPKKTSHKGQNGKLLLVGGSKLFHAASKWSLDVASRIVDMVFYSSVAENNELIKEAKGKFWNGIVIARENLEEYIHESDCVLMGPGMERDQETQDLANYLLKKYPDKKFVVDAGALQMIDPNLLNKNHIITPHGKEMSDLLTRSQKVGVNLDEKQVTILQKGAIDIISWFDSSGSKDVYESSGGNVGMTKGGTGDVLAGLVGALFCKNEANVAAIVASAVNKQAGDELHKTVGPFFNASDLAKQVPLTFWHLLK